MVGVPQSQSSKTPAQAADCNVAETAAKAESGEIDARTVAGKEEEKKADGAQVEEGEVTATAKETVSAEEAEEEVQQPVKVIEVEMEQEEKEEEGKDGEEEGDEGAEVEVVGRDHKGKGKKGSRRRQPAKELADDEGWITPSNIHKVKNCVFVWVCVGVGVRFDNHPHGTVCVRSVV